jgi:ribulose-5-phosphate 4-epimerase/fuculose-1-phosphate aldolase
MKEKIRTLLLQDQERFEAKGLFGQPGDSFSMRIPGQPEFLLVTPDHHKPESVSINCPGSDIPGLHARLYRNRTDAGSVLISGTPWSAALASAGETIPVLFDEQARHLGEVTAPVPEGDLQALETALQGGANIAIVGERRLCLGATPERVVFNAELFEKCTQAFLIALSSGRRIRRIPWLVRVIAGGRLKKDQARAAESLDAGQIPEGMNAY